LLNWLLQARFKNRKKWGLELNSNPLVSVVIPLYNGEEFIINTLKSVLNQTFEKWECLIIDDGSTDNSLVEIEKFITRNENTKIRVISTVNCGVSAARNTGIINARGKYISLLDQDDIWLPNKLTSQVKLMEENPQLGGVLCGFSLSRMVDGIHKPMGSVLSRDITRLTSGWLSFRGNGALISSTLLFRNGEFPIYFDTTFSHVSDLDFFLRIQSVYELGYQHDILVYYNQHKNQMHALSHDLLKEYPLLIDSLDLGDYGFSRKELIGNLYVMCLMLDLKAKDFERVGLYLVKIFTNSVLTLFSLPLYVLFKRIGRRWIRSNN